jgi:hypothetical protein
MEDLIVCSRCKVSKKESDFWFDKRRGKVRKPCRDCSNKKASLSNRLRYANNLITRCDVINHYKGKGLSDEVLNFFTDIILLNRNIKKMETPLIKSDGISTHIFCPICGDFQSVELPCGVDKLIEIGNLFIQIHKHDDI